MKMLKKIKNSLYRVLIETDINIRYYHQKYVSQLKRDGKYNIIKSLAYLVKLTVLIRILKLKKYSGQTFEKPYYGGSESELSYKSPDEYAGKLLKYDVISFDVFDTLVFRPFNEPADLFYITGQKLEYMDFANIRIQAEQKTRAEARSKKQSDEIDIRNIYDYMEKYCGIKAEDGISAEYETELELIYANPFMKRVYDILVCNGKKIIAVTDMYLTGEMIKNILDNCGYANIIEIFVSNEYGCGKYNGKLFEKALNKTGRNFSYVHIGDNWQSDFENPKKYNIDSVYYDNANHKGGYYRTYDMSAIVGSAYRGIVNSHFHSGLNKYAAAYEYGFMCGGIFVIGYCSFIRQYAENNGIEKILFLSRDGEVLKKVYDMLYPGGNSEYVYWSRNAAAKLGCGKYRHDYFRRFIYHKINTGVSLEKVFEAMELEFLLPRFIMKYKIKGADELDTAAADKTVEFFVSEWDKIIQVYSNEHEAAKNYYKQVIGENRRVCTVDIGWAGSGGVILAHLAKDVWKIDCEMFTLLAGTNTPHNHEPNMSEGFLQAGKMAAYIYSQSHNRHLYHCHNPGVMHNVFFEMLLSSKSGSLKGFRKSDKSVGYELVLAKGDCGGEDMTDEIQRGIYDFAGIYRERFIKYDYMLNISGSDAYAPFRHLTADENKYFRHLFRGVYFEIGLGGDSIKKIV